MVSTSPRPRASFGVDFYLTRAVRYVPVEALTAYLALQNLLEPLHDATSSQSPANAVARASMTQTVLFIVFAVAAPIYIWGQGRSSGISSYRPALLTMMSFIVWSLAMGAGIFLPPVGILSGLYNSTFAALLFIAFTLGAGFLNLERAGEDAAAIDPPISVDGYLARTAKYMPANALGGYLAVQNLLGFKSAAIDGATTTLLAHYLSFAVFILCLLSIPFVLWIVGRRFGPYWMTQAAVSMAGFLIWVYAIGGRLFLPGLGELQELHNGALAATLLLVFTAGSGLIVPATSRSERLPWIVFAAYSIAIVIVGAGIVLLFVHPQWIEQLGPNVLALLALSFVPLLGTTFFFHRQAMVTVLKPALPACVTVLAVVYGLARLALLDLAVGPAPAIVPGDCRMEGPAEDRHTVAMWLDRDGAARLDRDGATTTIDRHGFPIRQAFLVSGGAAALTVDRSGAAHIVDLHGAGLRGALEMPRLPEIMRAHLWDPYVAPLARWALFVAAQVLPLEMPEAVRGRRGRVFRDCAACPEMIEIDPGHFLMGSPLVEAGRDSDEFPRHFVNIERPFAVGRFAVTFEEWDACVREKGGCNGYEPNDDGWGRGRQPVINVSWDDAKTYVDWLSRKTGQNYRLLSEAEWEYAARGGSTSAYAWGDEIGVGHANCAGCGSQWDGRQTAPVGSFAPNGFGLYDMHGNVWEWVEDCYMSSYKDAPADGSARLMSKCDTRVLRGGSYY